MAYDPSLYTTNTETLRAHGQTYVTNNFTLVNSSCSLVTLGMGSASAYTITLPNASSVVGHIYDFKRDSTTYGSFGFLTSGTNNQDTGQPLQPNKIAYTADGSFAYLPGGNGVNSYTAGGKVPIYVSHSALGSFVVAPTGTYVSPIGVIGGYLAISGEDANNGNDYLAYMVGNQLIFNTKTQGFGCQYTIDSTGGRVVQTGLVGFPHTNGIVLWNSAGASSAIVLVPDSSSVGTQDFANPLADANHIYTGTVGFLNVWDYNGNLRTRYSGLNSGLVMTSAGWIFGYNNIGLVKIDPSNGTFIQVDRTPLNTNTHLYSSWNGDLFLRVVESFTNTSLYVYDAEGNIINQFLGPFPGFLRMAAGIYGNTRNYEVSIATWNFIGNSQPTVFYSRNSSTDGLVTISPVSTQTLDGASSLQLNSPYDGHRITAVHEASSYGWRVLNRYPPVITPQAPTTTQYYVTTSTPDLSNEVLLNSSNPLPVTSGGTGASSVTTARANLSAAKLGTNSDITSATAITSQHNNHQHSTTNVTLASSSPGTTIVMSATAPLTVTLPDASSISGNLITIVNEASAQMSARHIISTNASQPYTPPVFSTDGTTMYTFSEVATSSRNMYGIGYTDTALFTLAASAPLLDSSGNQLVSTDGFPRFWQMCTNSTGSTLYVARAGTDTHAATGERGVHVIDTASRQQTRFIGLDVLSAHDGTLGVAISPDDSTLYCLVSSGVIAISTSTFQVTNPSQGADGGTGWILVDGSGQIYTTSGSSVYTPQGGTIPFAGAGTLTKDGQDNVFVQGTYDAMMIQNGGSTTSLIPGASGYLFVSQDGQYLYCGNFKSLTVFDTATKRKVYTATKFLGEFPPNGPTDFFYLGGYGNRFIGGNGGSPTLIYQIDVPGVTSVTIQTVNGQKIGPPGGSATTYTLTGPEDSVTLQAVSHPSGNHYHIISKIVN